MPKYPTDKRRYYDEMESQKRSISRGKFKRQPEHDAGDEPSQSRYHHTEESGSRRPGQPPHMQPSSSYAATHSRPLSSSEHSGFIHSSARGEHIKGVHRPQPTFSETASEPTSVAGSVGEGGEYSSVARGGVRGRRVLPENLITRPRELKSKQGGHGTSITLQANYFKLLSTTNWCLYKYAVSFNPEEDHTAVRKGLVRMHSDTIGAYIFDGSVMYTSNRLPEPLQLTSRRTSDNVDILITFQHAGDMVKGDHDYIQFFNIIMRKCLDYLQLQLVGRNYFDAKNKTEITDYKLEFWPGYITSIRQHEHDILLCAEVTHKIMRTETLLDILNHCFHANSNNYQTKFKEQVVGVVVITDYNNNTYKVDDVDFHVTPSSTFTKRDGTEISYVDYYNSRYRIQIHELRQPLLVTKSKPRNRRGGEQSELVYLVPELCRSTGLTDQMRNDFKLMGAVAKHTRVSPNDRIQKLMTFNQRLQSVPNVVQEFINWNLKLDRSLIDVPARVLPAEKIYFGNDVFVEVNSTANWNNDFRNKSLLQSGCLDDWVLISPNRFRRDCQGFVNALIKVGSGMKFNIQMPYVVDLRDDNPATYAEALEDVKSRSSPMMILCVVSNNRVDRYSAIKKKCCVERPVPTQVILSKNLLPGKSQLSIATKVAIQMNCKIGGIPWLIKIPSKGIMVVGFDVCHDTNSKEKDFGAMVASIDSQCGRYFSAVSSHRNGEELSNDLSVNLCKALNQFKIYNYTLPSKIIIYRDGVGEGQIPYVVKCEVEQIKLKLSTIYSDPDDIKMAYIVVTKKINTRLFYNRNNPNPGTVVDDVVTDPAKYDFLIVSQHVNNGTVTPSSYNIVADTSGLDADKLQRLTYKFCHMYFNWSGTVRVPAPCQYAHKLAFLVSQAVHQSPNTVLETLLYFL